jgi:hypothetical protein
MCVHTNISFLSPSLLSALFLSYLFFISVSSVVLTLLDYCISVLSSYIVLPI